MCALQPLEEAPKRSFGLPHPKESSSKARSQVNGPERGCILYPKPDSCGSYGPGPSCVSALGVLAEPKPFWFREFPEKRLLLRGKDGKTTFGCLH